MSSTEKAGLSSLANKEIAAHELVEEIFRLKAGGSSNKYDLPEHLKDFKNQYETLMKNEFSFPIIHILSPRSKKIISQLPPPDALELAKVNDHVNKANSVDPRKAYKCLTSVSDFSRAQAHMTHEDEKWEQKQLQKQNKLVDYKTTQGNHMDVLNASSEYLLSTIRRKKRIEDQNSKLQQFSQSSSASVVSSQSTVSLSRTNLISQQKSNKSSQLIKILDSSNAVAVAKDMSCVSSLSPMNQTSHRPLPRSLPSSSSSDHPRTAQTARTLHSDISSSSSSLLYQNNSSSRLINVHSSAPNLMELKSSTILTATATTATTRISPKNEFTIGSRLTNAVTSSNVKDDRKLEKIEKRNVATAIIKEVTEKQSQFDRALKHQQKANQKFANYVDVIKTALYDDVGIDVDEAFTKRRIFGKAIQMLIYHVYGCKMRTAFCRLLTQSRAATAALRLSSALLIHRYMRKFIARQFAARKQALLDQRKEMERLEELKRQLRIKQLAIRVVGSIRMYIYYRKRLRFRSAVQIQRMARGKLAKLFVMKLIVINNHRAAMALKIQCSYRQHLAYRQLILQTKIEFVRQWMENIKLEQEEQIRILRVNGASSTIALAYRKHCMVKKLHKLVYWHHMEVAVVIQKVVRGFVARRKVARMKKEKIRKSKKRLDATLLIQRNWRGHRARVIYAALVQEKNFQKEVRRRKKIALLNELELQVKKKNLKELLDEMNPFRYVKEREMATRIQKVFRGHHWRKRAFVLRCNTAIERIERKRSAQYRAAVVIQRIWRGTHCRKRLRKAKQSIYVIRLQCFWRQKLAVRHANWRRSKSRALGIVNKVFVRFIRRRTARRIRKQEIRFSSSIVILQRLARKYIGEKWISELKLRLRAEYEQRKFAEGKMFQVLCAIQLQILVDSMAHDISKPFPCLSKEECPLSGPFQSLFIAAVGPKARTDPGALVTNKLDAKTFSKFASKMDGFMVSTSSLLPGTANSASTVKTQERRSRRQEQFVAALFQAVDADIFQLPRGQNSFNQNDLDLFFYDAKANSSDGAALNYADFIKCIQTIAESFYVANGKSRSTRKKPGDTDELIKSGRSHPPSDALISNHKSPRATAPVRKNRSKFDDPKYLTCSVQELCGPTPNLGMIFLIQLFSVNRNHNWIEPVMRWIEEESKARLSRFVLRIQCLLRGKLAHNKKTSIFQIRAHELQILAKERKLIKIQSLVRRFIQRRRVVRIAQKVLVKYVSHDGNSYWYNPSTRTSTWTKPKILGSFESASISLPPAGLEIVIKCSNSCGGIAKVSCIECEDSYCLSCFASIHCKGNRRFHSKKDIPICSYCNYQVATKHCLTCILQVPKAGSTLEFFKPSERGTYCDVCFIHVHDETEASLSLNGNKKKAEYNLLCATRDAYLIGQSLHQKINTTHKFENFVQACEECQWRCASWRCAECNQIYCHKCLVGLHSMGGPFARHTSERLPYYTPNLHSSYQKDAIEQRIQKALVEERRINKIKQEELRLSSCLKIQAWWRGRYYARDGKKILKGQRRRIRAAFRLRQRENKEKRVGFVYKLRNILGRNPPLASDTREELVLATLPVTKRQRAREYIWKNLEDWGHYRVSKSHPRKGEPKHGFDVGTVEELIEQAQLGGFRLPGGIYLKNEKSRHKTETDLTGHLVVGHMIRIQTHLFYVREITERSITLDRKWLEPSISEPLVMYRVPASSHEKNGWYYKNLFRLRVFNRKNLVTQGALRVYLFGMKKLISYSLSMARTARNAGSLEDSAEWKAYALACSDKAKRASKYLMGPQDGLALEYDVNEIEEKTKEQQDKLAKKNVIKIAQKSSKSSSNLAASSPVSPTQSAVDARSPKRYDGDDASSVGGSSVTGGGVAGGGGGGGSVMTDAEKEEEEMSKPQHLRYGRQPGVRWYATPLEIIERKNLEKKMTNEEIIAQADDWEEFLNPSTNAFYYVNKLTFEVIDGIPRPISLKRQVEEELMRSKAVLNAAQQRLNDLESMQKGKIKLKSSKR